MYYYDNSLFLFEQPTKITILKYRTSWYMYFGRCFFHRKPPSAFGGTVTLFPSVEVFSVSSMALALQNLHGIWYKYIMPLRVCTLMLSRIVRQHLWLRSVLHLSYFHFRLIIRPKIHLFKSSMKIFCEDIIRVLSLLPIYLFLLHIIPRYYVWIITLDKLSWSVYMRDFSLLRLYDIFAF